MVGMRPFFDLPTIVQLADQSRHTLRMQLYRWTKNGVIVPLRRGLYALGKPYRRVDPNPAVLANELYRPSYLSFHWALGYYGLIPEKVVLYTSATTRKPAKFQNEFGQFRYSHIKTDCFSGYSTLRMGDAGILIASPEKALLDFWHLEKGEWTEDRMVSMRFQNFAMVSLEKLRHGANAFHSPRLERAVRHWCSFAATEQEGEKLL